MIWITVVFIFRLTFQQSLAESCLYEVMDQNFYIRNSKLRSDITLFQKIDFTTAFPNGFVEPRLSLVTQFEQLNHFITKQPLPSSKFSGVRLSTEWAGQTIESVIAGFDANEKTEKKSLPNNAKIIQFNFWHSTVTVDRSGAVDSKMIDGEEILTFVAQDESSIFQIPYEHHRVHKIEFVYEVNGQRSSLIIGNQLANDVKTTYDIGPKQVFLGLKSQYRQFEVTFQGHGHYATTYYNIVGYFGIVVLDKTCWCPSTPTDFTVSKDDIEAGTNKRSVTLSWFQPNLGNSFAAPASYQIYHSKDGVQYSTQTVQGSQTTFTIQQYAPSDTLFFKIEAQTSVCNSPQAQTQATAHNLCLKRVTSLNNQFFNLIRVSDYETLNQRFNLQKSSYLNKIDVFTQSNNFQNQVMSGPLFSGLQFFSYTPPDILTALEPHGTDFDKKGAPSFMLAEGQYISKFEFWHGQVDGFQSNQVDSIVDLYGKSYTSVQYYLNTKILIPQQYHRVNMVTITVLNQYGATTTRTFGNKQTNDQYEVYNFKKSERVVGVESWQEKFLLLDETPGVQQQQQQIGVPAFFGLIVYEGACGCPSAPVNFQIKSDQTNAQGLRNIVVEWLSWSDHMNGGKPDSYLLEIGTDGVYTKREVLTESQSQFTTSQFNQLQFVTFKLTPQKIDVGCQPISQEIQTSRYQKCMKIYDKNDIEQIDTSRLFKTTEYNKLANSFDQAFAQAQQQVAFINKISYYEQSNNIFTGQQIAPKFAGMRIESKFGAFNNEGPLHGFNLKQAIGEYQFNEGDLITQFSFWHSDFVEYKNQPIQRIELDGEEYGIFMGQGGSSYTLPIKFNRVNKVEFQFITAGGQPKSFTIGQALNQDKQTTYTFGKSDRVIGVESWYREMFLNEKLQGHELTLIANVVSYFSVIVVDQGCFCPVVPRNFIITSDRMSSQIERELTFSWTPFEEYQEGGKPQSFILQYGRQNGLMQETVIEGNRNTFVLRMNVGEFENLDFKLTAKGDGCDAGPVTITAINIYTKPDPPVLKFNKKINCDSAELTFTPPVNTGGLPLIKYVLFKSERGMSNVVDDRTITAPTSSNVFNVNGLSGRQYSYYMVAFTRFGKSVNSNTINVDTSELPGPATLHRIQFDEYQNNDRYYLFWQAPTPLCAQIKGYRIEGTSQGGTFRKLQCSFPNNDQLQLSCSLSLSELQRQGVLQSCDTLNTRVIVETVLGDTPPSNTATQQIIAKPQPPTDLRDNKSITSFNKIGLLWTKPAGSCPITCCKLFWKPGQPYCDPRFGRGLQGAYSADFQLLDGCNNNYQATVTSLASAQVELGHSYTFKAQCSNSAGDSDFSNQVTIQAAAVPACPRNPSLKTLPTEPTLIFLDWEQPDNSMHLLGYEVYVGEQQKQVCHGLNGYNNPLGRSCAFRMQELQQEPFNLRGGDTLRVKVVARNAWGTSTGCEEVSIVLQWPTVEKKTVSFPQWKWILLGILIGLLAASLLVALAALIYWCCNRGRSESTRYVDEYVDVDVELPPEQKIFRHEPRREVEVGNGRREVPWQTGEQSDYQRMYIRSRAQVSPQRQDRPPVYGGAQIAGRSPPPSHGSFARDRDTRFGNQSTGIYEPNLHYDLMSLRRAAYPDNGMRGTYNDYIDDSSRMNMRGPPYNYDPQVREEREMRTPPRMTGLEREPPHYYQSAHRDEHSSPYRFERDQYDRNDFQFGNRFDDHLELPPIHNPRVVRFDDTDDARYNQEAARSSYNQATMNPNRNYSRHSSNGSLGFDFEADN